MLGFLSLFALENTKGCSRSVQKKCKKKNITNQSEVVVGMVCLRKIEITLDSTAFGFLDLEHV